MNIDSGKLIIISGQSGVGKTKLVQSFKKFFPEISKKYELLVYYVSRPARPGECDGLDRYFVTREEVEKFKSNSAYVVVKARHDLHAVHLDFLFDLLKKKNVIFEGNPLLAIKLIEHPALKNVEKLSIFITPISKEEVLLFNRKDSIISLKDAITKIISMKLLKRTLKQKPVLSLEDYEDIINRAESAYDELRFATRFDFVIPNHDGEESENWDCFKYPIGDARRTLYAFIDLLNGVIPESMVEKWEESVFNHKE